MITAISEMFHPQPQTPVATYNTLENSIVSGTAKQRISGSIDMVFYWVRDRIQKNRFHIFWEEGGGGDLANNLIKHRPICNHKTMRPRCFKEEKKHRKIQKPAK